MKKVLKRVGAVLGAMIGVAGALALYVQVDGIPRYDKPVTDTRTVAVTKERVEQGAKIASLVCAGCHENHETHRFTGRHMADVPPELGVIYSKNITQHPTKGVGKWTDGELRYFLRTGVRPDGQYVPPYMAKLPHTSDDDLDSIIAFLRGGDPRVASADVDSPGVTQPGFLTKALSHVAFKPLPYPKQPVVAPPKTDAVGYGRYLVVSLDCYGCHSADFKSRNVLEPEKTPGFMGGGNTFRLADGKTIDSANLTSDAETGIGGWTEAQFVRAVRKGFRPDGRVLHYPMDPKPELSDEDAAAIYAYLRSIPAIRHAVRRPTTPPAVADSRGGPGKALYDRYGCVSCHGETGKGAVGDLRGANTTYPTDADLRRWIDDAPSIKPNTKMPGWKGVIKEEDYVPLMTYVRALSAAKAERSGTLSTL
jgi:mono/diheme cytochrome c family protein